MVYTHRKMNIFKINSAVTSMEWLRPDERGLFNFINII